MNELSTCHDALELLSLSEYSLDLVQTLLLYWLKGLGQYLSSLSLSYFVCKMC